MGRPKKDKVHFMLKIDRELKLELVKYPNIEKSALVNKLLWDWIKNGEKKYI